MDARTHARTHAQLPLLLGGGGRQLRCAGYVEVAEALALREVEVVADPPLGAAWHEVQIPY